MKAALRTVEDHGVRYSALMFVCPGCAEPYTLPSGESYTPSGIHMLPVNSSDKSPSWAWDGDIEAPTVSPSILTRWNDRVCHSFLRAGVFEFLDDCTHSLAGQSVPMVDLPGWVVE